MDTDTRCRLVAPLRRLAVTLAAAIVASTAGVVIAPSTPAAAAGPRIGLIGDSTLTGIRTHDAFGPLRRFDFIFNAAACRRTMVESCHLPGLPPPMSALETLRSRAGQWGSLVVMVMGYNDPGTHFGASIDAVMAEAARQGIPHIMWLTVRTADVSFVPAIYTSRSDTFRDNNIIMLQKARQYGGRLQVADWAGYTADHNEWFTSDGVHYTASGALVAAQFIATNAQRVLDGRTITPSAGVGSAPSSAGNWSSLRYGMGGTAISNLQRVLVEKGLPLPGGITGIFNVPTLYAVQTFQRGRGIHPNGVVDELTARALGLYSGPWTDVRIGTTSTVVQRIQQALISRGISVRGGASGRFDIWTWYAVRTFQRHNGLTVSGVVDGATARALGLRTAPEPSALWTTLAQGSTGLNVARAQRALMDRGVNVRGGATGRFDVWTFYAVQTFQRYNGLQVSGVIDVATAQKLGLFSLSNPVATWVNLGLGSTGSMVAKAERCLAFRGVRVVDGADGVFKIGDFYAVTTFQRYNALPVTGVIDLATAHKLAMLTSPCTASAQTVAILAAAAPPTTIATTSSSTTTTSTTTTSTPTTTTTTSPATTTTAATTTALGGRAWLDLDGDGIQDAPEPGSAAVVIRLLDAAATEIANTTTDSNGVFEFTDLSPGSYVLEADVPPGHLITAPNQGTDDDADSDFAMFDPDSRTTRSDTIELSTTARDNLGLGFTAAPAETTTTTTTTTGATTTTTAAAATSTTQATTTTTTTTTIAATTTSSTTTTVASTSTTEVID